MGEGRFILGFVGRVSCWVCVKGRIILGFVGEGELEELGCR